MDRNRLIQLRDDGGCLRDRNRSRDSEASVPSRMTGKASIEISNTIIETRVVIDPLVKSSFLFITDRHRSSVVGRYRLMSLTPPGHPINTGAHCRPSLRFLPNLRCSRRPCFFWLGCLRSLPPSCMYTIHPLRRTRSCG